MLRNLRMMASAILMTALMACSGQDVEEGEHVWKEQERALERARETEQQMQDGFERQREEIDRQTR
jgi:hypothetical protein